MLICTGWRPELLLVGVFWAQRSAVHRRFPISSQQDNGKFPRRDPPQVELFFGVPILPEKNESLGREKFPKPRLVIVVLNLVGGHL